MIRPVFLAMLFGVGLVSNALAHGGGGGGGFVTVYGAAPQTVPTARTGDYSRIRSVAVISAVAQTLTLEKAGLLIPEKKSADISAWKLDEKVEQEIAQYLGSRYSIKTIAPDRAALAQIPNGTWDYSAPALRKYLRSFPADGIDAFIVVRPDLEEQTPGLAGLALDMGTDILMRSLRPIAWANYEIDVVDAGTLAIIGKAYSRIRLRDGQAPDFVGLICSEAVRPADGLVLNENQRALLHDIYGNMLNVSLLETLRALDLGVALPDIGARSVVDIPQGKDPYPQVKSVAIASVLGSRLSFDHMGQLAFVQTHERKEFPDWYLDKQIEDSIRAAVANRFAVKAFAFDRAAMSGDALVDADGKLNPRFPGLQPAQDVDAYIVVVPFPRLIWNFGPLQGLGVANRTPVLGASQATAIYADYAIAVLDAHTLKLISVMPGTVGPRYPEAHPLFEIDMGLWPDHPDTATPVQIDGIHTALTRLLNDSVPETILRMGLTGRMISTDPLASSAAVTSH